VENKIPKSCFAVLAALFACFLAINAYSFSMVSPSTTTYIVGNTSALALAFNSSSRCLNSNNSSLDLNVTVLKNNSLDPNASVTASVFKPDSDINAVSFSGANDGNYSLAYFFDQNGTYRFEVHGVDGAGTGDINAFIHVGSTGMRVSFLNNGQQFSAGTTQTTTARVLNTDGNIFEGIDGNLTIFYPAGSTFVNAQRMTNSGNGQYTYTFTVPSNSGTYNETAVFACGLNTDTNTQGFFTVPSSGSGSTDTGGSSGGTGGGGGGGGRGPKTICGNFVCEKGETARTCFSDCAVSPGPDGLLLGWKFENGHEIAQPTALVVDLKNNGNQKNDYFVRVVITQGREVEYIYEEKVENVEINELRNVVLQQKWVPILAGSHEIVVSLHSLDKRTKFDEIIESFILGGSFTYDVVVECLSQIVRQGSDARANISYLNLGDFFGDVDLSYWVEDSQGRIFNKNSLPVAIYPDEPKVINGSILIGENFVPGTYFFKASVLFGDSEKSGSCSFLVETEKDYYENQIGQLAAELEELKKSSADLKEKGYNTLEVEEKLEKIGERIEAFKENFSNASSDENDTELEKIKNDLDLAKQGLKDIVQGPVSLQNILLAGFVLIIGAGIFFFAQKKHAHSILGFDKPVHSKPFKGKSLIDKLLGLK